MWESLGTGPRTDGEEGSGSGRGCLYQRGNNRGVHLTETKASAQEGFFGFEALAMGYLQNAKK